MRAAPVLVVLATVAVSGCVVVPDDERPLMAYPGPDKTPAQFAQDDAGCRGTGATALAQPQPAPPNATGEQAAPVQPTPASVYFACMESHGNAVAAAPAEYARYAYPYPYAYGLYGYPGYYPGVFADGLLLDRGVGLYGGFYGGYRGGYRGGFREGGFREGGCFRGAGGLRGGGGFREGGGSRR